MLANWHDQVVDEGKTCLDACLTSAVEINVNIYRRLLCDPFNPRFSSGRSQVYFKLQVCTLFIMFGSWLTLLIIASTPSCLNLSIVSCGSELLPYMPTNAIFTPISFSARL